LEERKRKKKGGFLSLASGTLWRNPCKNEKKKKKRKRKRGDNQGSKKVGT
jgi:hypothetical protein